MAALHNDVEPMVTTKWNQGAKTYDPTNPYNGDCPKVDGMLTLTGCMATALAQVLNYHKWPKQLNNPLAGFSTMHGLTIDELPVVAFDWENMADDYYQPTTDAQQKAVAQLMRYCGQAIQMDYTTSTSNGFYYDLDMLVNDFGYHQGVAFVHGDNYSVSEWENMIYQELAENRPVVYGAQGSVGGHAFVLDGYEVSNNNGYYHVNWDGAAVLTAISG